MDIPYGNIIHGLAVGSHDQIVISGGEVNGSHIDVLWTNRKEV